MNLLCLDIGNSHTMLGVFSGDQLVAHWKVASDERRTADEWQVLIASLVGRAELGSIGAVSTCCTVPVIMREMRTLYDRYYGDYPLTVVGPGIKTGVPILTDNPREVGADRIVNALAAVEAYGGPCIIVDFGTATTFDVIDARNRYLGGAIAPGVQLSLEVLGRRGAQLRSVELAMPRGVIGKNTVEAIQSGVVYGFAGQVDGIVDRLIDELGAGTEDVTVVATGSYPDVVVDNCETITMRDPWLTLNGLRLVHEKNHG